ncbi:WxL protein peptidoglycan domain-containing protein [Plantactinospora sp. WMMB334]|uniref:WxL protein peptidoglycan domain-containing protein n=1 Tax=Plantactinospora sp. WMMB334 TaxID=3404119 RepID=UPI003B932BEF
MTAHRSRRVVAALAAAAVSLLTGTALPGPAGAAAPGDEFRWTVEPAAGGSPRSQFNYVLTPGQRIDDRVVVTNRAGRPLTFTVYATDAATSADGAFALPPASEPAHDVGAWVDLGRQTRTLRAGERAVLPFRLTVPGNATPGDHAAGIVAGVVEEQTNAEGQRVNVERRVGARIYLRVNGPLAPMVDVTAVEVRYANPWLPFTRGPATITYQVVNPGNVRAGGTARVSATGPFGLPLAGDREVPLPEMLPGARVTLVQRVDGVLPAGMITGTVRVAASTSQGPLPVLVSSGTVWHVPWTLLCLLVGVVGAVLALLRWRRRRRTVEPVERSPAREGGPADRPDPVVGVRGAVG